MNASALAAAQGQLVLDGHLATSDVRLEVRDPGKVSELVGTVYEASPQHVNEAVTAARTAGAGWAAMPLEGRIQLLETAVQQVEQQLDPLARILTSENGGTLFESGMDLSRGLALFRDLLDRAPRVLADRTDDDESRWLAVERRPVGVTALIVPWNSPVVLTMSKLAPALVAGNTVVVKPSVLAPLAVGQVLRIVSELLPPGVLNVVHGDAAVGSVLVNHPAVRKVSFTGSVAVGRQIMAAAAGGVKRISLELGGNDAAVVLDDADLSSTIPSLAKGIYTRAGQICFAVKRLYVPLSRHDEIVDALADEVSSYRVGHGTDEETTFGPLISAAARDRVVGLIMRATAEGGKVVQLGQPTSAVDWDGGHYMLPHIVTGLDQGAELVGVEQFGPVVPIIAYEDVDQAVTMANDSDYGLCSSVWGADVSRAVDIARRIEAGATFINSHNVWSLSFDMPFGGVKNSGIGRERTDQGILEYVEEHAIRLAH